MNPKDGAVRLASKVLAKFSHDQPSAMPNKTDVQRLFWDDDYRMAIRNNALIRGRGSVDVTWGLMQSTSKYFDGSEDGDETTTKQKEKLVDFTLTFFRSLNERLNARGDIEVLEVGIPPQNPPVSPPCANGTFNTRTYNRRCPF